MTELSPQPNIAPPAPPPGAILPPGFVPPAAAPGYTGGPGPVRPMPPGQGLAPGRALQAPQQPQQEQLDPQSIKIQAAITELENQCNAVRSRCMAQAADIALLDAMNKRLNEMVQQLTAERDHWKTQAEGPVSSEPVE
jgi:hypothetical protein